MARLILQILLGLTLVAAIAGAISLLVMEPPARPGRTSGPAQPRIARGFVGVAQFGRWRLICSPEPPPPIPSAAPRAAKPSGANQCRINQEVRTEEQPNPVILAANLSLVGPAKRPAAMLRLPPTVHDGDKIVLLADDAVSGRATARGCTEIECIAAGDLTQEEWNRITAAKALQVSFPARDRQRVLVKVSAEGLADAARAMAAAQTTN